MLHNLDLRTNDRHVHQRGGDVVVPRRHGAAVPLEGQSLEVCLQGAQLVDNRVCGVGVLVPVHSEQRGSGVGGLLTFFLTQQLIRNSRVALRRRLEVDPTQLHPRLLRVVCDWAVVELV